MANIRRLWAVVSPKTDEVIYSSFDYTRAKKAYDVLMRPYTDDLGMSYPSVHDVLGYKLCRYDLSPHYSFTDEVQAVVNSDISKFLDFILMKSGKKQEQPQPQPIN